MIKKLLGQKTKENNYIIIYTWKTELWWRGHEKSNLLFSSFPVWKSSGVYEAGVSLTPISLAFLYSVFWLQLGGIHPHQGAPKTKSSSSRRRTPSPPLSRLADKEGKDGCFAVPTGLHARVGRVLRGVDVHLLINDKFHLCKRSAYSTLKLNELCLQ